MNRLGIILLAVACAVGCGKKVCEPGSTQACECAKDLEGAQVCASSGEAWWGCVCTPAIGVLAGDPLKERTTCRRMEVIVEVTRTYMEKNKSCPSMADLQLDPGDAWGESLVVVCSLENVPTVTSSGGDGRFGSQDDLTPDNCQKIEKFGSMAKYDEAMRQEQDLVAEGSDEVEQYVVPRPDASTEGIAKPRPLRPPKPPSAGKPKPPESPGYFDPIGGLDDPPRKKHM
ncbi:MAG: hypothetical protein JRG91_18100 [Deltaproteobacteria bacterium]|nr:hypothetical protein [Deltaproteobacteria bacterium]